ncbi:heme NO-binding domain-containing protein [Noviherbaspirillum saxi]|uniref:Heme NO-binding domain-containing protein n=1 Tax=Noviherbaspirillum saxi TaxID=2320863 RepID=A0A3A3FQK3_9BURK|nr:heme NO-binding domain-containing protein [Noviherbaspirillum saxi]RJF97484.1 hypothetical protein D3871_02275 [Noviherbaspirillum saxi]
MKGIVFREFINMVEESFSPDMADKIISSSKLTTAGAYTSVGNYDHREIVELVSHLSAATGTSVPDLLRAFGEHLFGRFAVLYPSHFAAQVSAFEFISILDNKIHVEVQKLYPDAELPQFQHEFPTPDRMVVVYTSKRPFADLAEGLIRGCINYFGGGISLTRENLPCDEGAHTRFALTR